jgi:hypothetical protein
MMNKTPTINSREKTVRTIKRKRMRNKTTINIGKGHYEVHKEEKNEI